MRGTRLVLCESFCLKISAADPGLSSRVWELDVAHLHQQTNLLRSAAKSVEPVATVVDEQFQRKRAR